jgi:membrane protein required for colicin V production
VDIAQTITSIGAFDWFVLGFVVVMFVLGYAQGVVRRLLGIAGVLFSFLLAANLRDTLGSFLASNWTQYPREYSYMLAFGVLFVLFEVIFTIVIQASYKPAPIFTRAPVLDELLGGLLGVVQALLVVGAGIVILDSFFRLTVGIGDQQIPQVKAIWGAVNTSHVVTAFRDYMTPVFVTIVGPLLPSDIQTLYPHS